MREIKFRGLDVSGNTWHYGFLAIPEVGEYAGRSFISNKVGMPLAFEVRPETVGQLTGLKDKNRVEIYEGDVVSIGSGEDTWKVRYDWGAFILMSIEHRGNGALLYWKCEDWPLEVIGNICENPELLET
ncbi:hypothetical protein LCGC14_2754050, partial [marine sediment metagenome]